MFAGKVYIRQQRERPQVEAVCDAWRLVKVTKIILHRHIEIKKFPAMR